MTALLGILCTDGVVVCADSVATFAAGQHRTIEQPFDKIDIVDSQVLVACTGQVGLGQRFHDVVERTWRQQKRNTHLDVGRAFAEQAVRDFGSTQAPQGELGAIVACGCKGQPHLIEFEPRGFQPEWKTRKLWYTAMGSGQLVLDPLLALMRRVFWQDGPPSLHEGVFAATWVMDHAINVNPGGVGGPLRVGVLERTGSGFSARMLEDGELALHRQNVSAAEDHLRQFPKRFHPAEAPELPPSPTG